ncbi:hypothetical protein M4D70_23140 [Brevibacillus borstelensis]|uniref:Ig-like domain-containing protein n=1 Tax=Brevibacillus borstelensis TaxID=45462 RepID=UPI00203E7A6A|nr:hypothetical protein [Brevibacillus borstelensis]MCM3625122.1 hypothetical protein [Brevibacillus borstelensis]
MEFAINNGTTSADLAKVKEAGYDVEFLASAKVFANGNNTSTDGKLGKLDNNQKFIYQVVITKDGQEVAKSERVEVTAKELANVVTSVESVALYIKQNGKDVKVESGKLAAGDVAKVKVVGKTANMKENDKAVDITSKVDLASNRVAVVTVDADGTVRAGSAKGDATITVKAGDIEQSLVVNAGNAVRTVDVNNSAIATKSLELATGATGKIEVSLKDQYGDTFVPANNAVQTAVVTADGKTIADAVTTSTVTDDLTVTLDLKAGTNAGTGKVVVNYVADVTTKLGEVNLTVKAPGDVVDYKLETTNKEYVLDLKDGATNEFTLSLNGYDKDGLLKEQGISLDAYTLESSNKDVATVDADGKVTAKGVGTAVITIYKTEDAFKTPVATQTVTVKDTTPAITKITFKEVGTLTSTEAVALNSIFDKVSTVDSDGKEATATVAAELTVEGVKVGTVVITAVPSKDNTFTANIVEDELVINGSGKGVINVAVLNNQGYVVDELNISVDIPVVEDPTDPAEPTDPTDPTTPSDENPPVVTVTPGDGGTITDGQDFVLTISAEDESDLYSLEVDHSMSQLPEFTLYAHEENPWGSTEAQEQATEAGVTATYDSGTKKWVLTFKADGNAYEKITEQGTVTFYFVVKDVEGNAFGSMDPTTPENTFTYTVKVE